MFFFSSVAVFSRKRHLRHGSHSRPLLSWLQLTSGCFQSSGALKSTLKGKRFSDVEAIKSSEKKFLDIPVQDFKNCFEQWP
jgi:hypothetical protein